MKKLGIRSKPWVLWYRRRKMDRRRRRKMEKKEKDKAEEDKANDLSIAEKQKKERKY